MTNFDNDPKDTVVVRVPLREYIELNEKVRRYDRMMDIINHRRHSVRTPRTIGVNNNGYGVR